MRALLGPRALVTYTSHGSFVSSFKDLSIFKETLVLSPSLLPHTKYFVV